jgi:hypothetical protein
MGRKKKERKEGLRLEELINLAEAVLSDILTAEKKKDKPCVDIVKDAINCMSMLTYIKVQVKADGKE